MGNAYERFKRNVREMSETCRSQMFIGTVGAGLHFKVRPRTKLALFLPITFRFNGYVDIEVHRVDPVSLEVLPDVLKVLSISEFSQLFSLLRTLVSYMSPQPLTSLDQSPCEYTGVCSICLDRKTDLVLPCMVRTTQHAFCELCMEQWCVRDKSCPACRLLLHSLSSEGFMMVSQSEADVRKAIEEGLVEMWAMLNQ